MVTLGDDLGTHKYMLMNTTLHMGDLPLVKNYAPLRLFTSLELLYYPGLKGADLTSVDQFKKDCRLSLGVGINMPMNSMVHGQVYWNVWNMGTRDGDIERRPHFNFNFGFF